MNGVAEQTGHWLQHFTAAPKAGGTWLQSLRDRAFARFSALGFPTTHDEEWRFTNVAPIARTAFEAAPTEYAVEYPARAEGALQLVFVNGRFSYALSRTAGLPKGLRVGRLADDPAASELYLGQQAGFDNHAFVALNTAFLSEGALVRVDRGVAVEQPIEIVYLTAAGGKSVVTHPRTLIVAGAGAQCTVVETFLSQGAGAHFTNAVCEVLAGEGAVVDHYQVQRENLQAYHAGSVQAKVGRSAHFSSTSISLGSALARYDIGALLSTGSHATLNGLYITTGTQHVDHHTAIDHALPHATSYELYKGILDGRSTAVFNGKIFVRPDAQKTDSKQTNKNLVLSDEAVINTKPELQILADDVRCTHGATIGQLDAESMFYLQSRGIGKREARGMLIAAFAQDVVDRIKVAGLRETLAAALLEKLHEHSA